MTRDDIIRMATEADREWDADYADKIMPEWLEEFAALVAAAVALAEPTHDYERWFVDGMSEQVRRDVEMNVMASLERFYAITVTIEREACARMVDHILKEGGGTYGNAIRARRVNP